MFEYKHQMLKLNETSLRNFDPASLERLAFRRLHRHFCCCCCLTGSKWEIFTLGGSSAWRHPAEWETGRKRKKRNLHFFCLRLWIGYRQRRRQRLCTTSVIPWRRRRLSEVICQPRLHTTTNRSLGFEGSICYLSGRRREISDRQTDDGLNNAKTITLIDCYCCSQERQSNKTWKKKWNKVEVGVVTVT